MAYRVLGECALTGWSRGTVHQLEIVTMDNLSTTNDATDHIFGTSPFVPFFIPFPTRSDPYKDKNAIPVRLRDVITLS